MPSSWGHYRETHPHWMNQEDQVRSTLCIVLIWHAIYSDYTIPAILTKGSEASAVWIRPRCAIGADDRLDYLLTQCG